MSCQSSCLSLTAAEHSSVNEKEQRMLSVRHLKIQFFSPRNESRNFSEASNHGISYGYEMISLWKQLVVALVLAYSIDLVILTFVVNMLHTGSVVTITLIPEEAEKQIKWVLTGLVSGSSGCPKLSM